ncbi:MAG TPA: hypothetical protein VGE13_00185 [Candidatus Saccharimonadales bacterium]
MKKRIQLMIIAVLAVSSLAFAPLAPSAVSAASPQEEICNGTGGTWSGGTCTKAGEKDLGVRIQDIVNVLLFVLGAIAVIVIVISGIKYATSDGDSGKISSAKNTILYAVVGLVVAILAYAIVNFVIGAF